MKLAAIDIGSNAARLLISEASSDKSGADSFNKLILVRVPLRLGFDVFENKIISPEKSAMFLHTMHAFKHLIEAYGVENMKAFATSAMRDAHNAKDMLALVKQGTDISIEIITGEAEASMVFENHVAEKMNKDNSYMYIDVGGGSTEISFFSNGILTFKRSFDIGTIRLLQESVTEEQWEDFKETLKAVTKGHKSVVSIGSGGNINKVFSLSKKKEGKSLPLSLLRDYYRELSAVKVPERIIKYNLRPDRADVIVPALQIYINAMRWSGAQEIYVPKIGLADGLINMMWQEEKEKS